MVGSSVEELPVAVLGEAALQARMVDLGAQAEAATAKLLEALGEWDDQRVWRHERGARPKEFLVLESAMAPAQAAAHITTARALRTCPLTAAALAAGRLSVAKARIVALFGVRGRVHEAFLECEADILEGCAELDLEQTALYLRIWEAGLLDPDGPPPPDDGPERALQFRNQPGGRHKLFADFDGEGGAAVRNFLEELARKLWENTEGEAVRPSHRRLLADALVLACQLAAGVPEGVAMRPPCVTVDIDLATLEGRAGRRPRRHMEPRRLLPLHDLPRYPPPNPGQIRLRCTRRRRGVGARRRAWGAQVAPPTDSGYIPRAAVIADPAGNHINLYQRVGDW